MHHGDRDSGDVIEHEMFEVREHATKLEDGVNDEKSDAVELECAHVKQPLPQSIPLKSRPRWNRPSR